MLSRCPTPEHHPIPLAHMCNRLYTWKNRALSAGPSVSEEHFVCDTTPFSRGRPLPLGTATTTLLLPKVVLHLDLVRCPCYGLEGVCGVVHVSVWVSSQDKQAEESGTDYDILGCCLSSQPLKNGPILLLWKLRSNGPESMQVLVGPILNYHGK